MEQRLDADLLSKAPYDFFMNVDAAPGDLLKWNQERGGLDLIQYTEHRDNLYVGSEVRVRHLQHVPWHVLREVVPRAGTHLRKS